MRTSLSLLILTFIPFFLPSTRAQTEKDLLRYSMSGLHGTARYIGTGGAFGAIGGDISSLRSNPAGIALLRKNELSFTPSFSNTRSKSRFMGNSSTRQGYGLAIDQFGLNLERPSELSAWERFPIAISYERIKSFNMKTRLRSDEPERSLLDHFVEISEGIPLSELNNEAPFTGEMAYQTFLMDPASDSTSYTHRLEGASHSMERKVERKGYMGRARIAFGANRKDRFYFGGSVGIPLLRFERKSTHVETVKSGSDVKDFRYEEQLSVSGFGIDVELGSIFRPNERWRFGISGRTPGLLKLEEDWSNRLKADHGPTRTENEGPVQGDQSYRIRLPYRLMASAAHFFEKTGLISVEYQFQDPSSGRLLPLSSQQGSKRFERSNRVIAEELKAEHSFKMGMEWRLAPFYLRGGYNLLLNSAQSGRYDQEAGPVQRFALGTGYRKSGYFLDLAYKRSFRPELTRPTHPEKGRSARTVHRIAGFVITGGARF